MRQIAYILTAFAVAMFLAACGTAPAPVQPQVAAPASACEGPSLSEDIASVLLRLDERPFASLDHDQARGFIVATGGADVDFLPEVAALLIWRNVPQTGASLVGVYDARGCRLGVAIFANDYVDSALKSVVSARKA